ncbi:MAG: XRE family transcriptional regulator [Bacteroidales bacterium]|nr:XRE family transcriptional regulator [Bacteroidales bacterium]
MHEKVHIGKMIHDKLREDRRSVSWLADQLHCDRSNVYRIFRTYHIDTEQLMRISIILGFDFFEAYSVCLKADKANRQL